MIEESFIDHKNYRWLRANIAFLGALVLIYIVDMPLRGRYGSTTLGLVYGGIAAAGVLYLMWYGMRKRSYHARHTTLKGCLSAHVWLGVSLALIVPLHSGFSFNINVHTFTYALMLLVILSGIWGAFQYRRLAPEIPSHRGSATVKKLLEQEILLQKDMQQISKEKSDKFLALYRIVNVPFVASIRGMRSWKTTNIPSSNDVAAIVATLPETERDDALKLVAVAHRRNEILGAIQREVTVISGLRLWLYFHLPLSFALLAALIIHIVTVLYYF